jgi:ubiquinone/menaquinone biosynthesis C-methylase UbiE
MQDVTAEHTTSPNKITSYVCPKCKVALRDLTCQQCGIEYPMVGGIPCFMSTDLSASDQQIRQIYDDIYRHHTEVWIDQGRADAFQAWFSALVASMPHARLLEVGCGEGALLATLPASEKFGIDPSVQALMRAKVRSSAECAVARCEQLPFPMAAFDVVLAVGVMEHFERVDDAIGEIRRVLRPGGHFIALIQTDQTRLERLGLKIRQYVIPRFRPVELFTWLRKWLRKKLHHPIVQPLRKSYSTESARECLMRNGLEPLRVINHRSEPTAPLAGSHVVILIASPRRR